MTVIVIVYSFKIIKIRVGWVVQALFSLEDSWGRVILKIIISNIWMRKSSEVLGMIEGTISLTQMSKAWQSRFPPWPSTSQLFSKEM